MFAMRTGVLVCLLLATGASAKATRTFILTGRVVDAITGRPIPAARVYDDSGATSIADDSGRYQLSLTKGTKYERAEAEGMYPAWTATPFRFETLVRDFHMLGRSSPTIEGRVASLPYWVRRPRVQVHVREPSRFVLSDTLGEFTLPLRSPGTYKISAHLQLGPNDSKISEETTVVVPVGGHVRVDLVLGTYFHATDHNPGFYSLWSTSHPSPVRIIRRPWHPGQSEFYMDADYVDRRDGIEKAIGTLPGVLTR